MTAGSTTRLGTHIVCRPHSGYESNTHVDYSHVPPHRLKKLAEQGYVRPVDPNFARPHGEVVENSANAHANVGAIAAHHRNTA
jgi:hypothetical protein